MTDKVNPSSEISDKPILSEPISMTQTEAFRLLGLSEDVDVYELDQRYWQLIKRYRGDPDANCEKLAMINEAYEIASGKRCEKNQKEEIRQSSFQIFGKTKKEWSVHFYYSWWKYILTLLMIVVVAFLIKHYFFTPRIDLNVVAVGHFEKYNNRIEDFAKQELAFLNPAVFSANLIVDNSEPGDETTMYGNLAAAAFLSVKNDVIITDERTFPFFLLNYDPIDDLYQSVSEGMTEEELTGIQPLWYSKSEHYELTYQYGFADKVENETDEDRQSFIYGIMITDPVLIESMGFQNRWESYPSTLVFCLSSNSKDKEKAAQFIRDILIRRTEFLEISN